MNRQRTTTQTLTVELTSEELIRIFEKAGYTDPIQLGWIPDKVSMFTLDFLPSKEGESVKHHFTFSKTYLS